MYYKCLLFDLDHTLLDFDVAEDLALTALLEEQGVDAVEDYKAYYKPMNKQLWRDLEAGRLYKKELIDSRFAKLFAHFGLVKDGVYLAQRYQYYLSQQGQVYKGAKDLLASLEEAGYDLYAATNGVAAIQEERLAQSGLETYFKAVFISEKAGTQKPHPDFFDYIASQIKPFNREETLMIGDSLTADIAGGNSYGIDTAWYNPNGLVNQTNQKPTYVLTSYQDLLDLLCPKD